MSAAQTYCMPCQCEDLHTNMCDEHCTQTTQTLCSKLCCRAVQDAKHQDPDVAGGYNQWQHYPSCSRLADGHCCCPSLAAGGVCRQQSRPAGHAAGTFVGLYSTGSSANDAAAAAWQQGMLAAPCKPITLIPQPPLLSDTAHMLATGLHLLSGHKSVQEVLCKHSLWQP